MLGLTVVGCGLWAAGSGLCGFILGAACGFLYGVRVIIWLVNLVAAGGTEAFQSQARWRQFLKTEQGQKTVSYGATELEGVDMVEAPGEMQ